MRLCEWPGGSEQATLGAEFCFYHGKLRDGLISDSGGGSRHRGPAPRSRSIEPDLDSGWTAAAPAPEPEPRPLLEGAALDAWLIANFSPDSEDDDGG